MNIFIFCCEVNRISLEDLTAASLKHSQAFPLRLKIQYFLS